MSERRTTSQKGESGEFAERFVPSEQGPLIAYEHAHRYAYAAVAIGDKRVLDLACGSGYGTQALHDAGANVVACDLARAAVRQARAPALCARAEHLPFVVETMTRRATGDLE